MPPPHPRGAGRIPSSAPAPFSFPQLLQEVGNNQGPQAAASSVLNTESRSQGDSRDVAQVGASSVPAGGRAGTPGRTCSSRATSPGLQQTTACMLALKSTDKDFCPVGNRTGRDVGNGSVKPSGERELARLIPSPLSCACSLLSHGNETQQPFQEAAAASKSQEMDFQNIWYSSASR